LLGKFGPEQAVSRELCQQALAACNNHVEEAEAFIRSGSSVDEALQGSTTVRGLYARTTESGTTHVNIQTGEVYVGNRLGMPVPQEIVANPDFARIFKYYVPYCTVLQNKEHLNSYHIQHGDVCPLQFLLSCSVPFFFFETTNSCQYNYYIEAWAPLKHVSHEVEVASQFSKQDKGSSKTEGASFISSVAPFVNAPVVRKAEGGGDQSNLMYLNVVWDTYQPGQCGWLSSLLDPLIEVRILEIE
jgi:hypothetical protein